MLIFFICITLLVLGYKFYSPFVEKQAGIDSKASTPQARFSEGVDYVAISPTKAFLIQFLNVAGVGPIFGPILGALYGPVALVQGTVQTPLRDGGLARLRYSDVYLRRDTAWRLVNSQHTVVQPGVPTAPRPGVAPRHAAWTGQDPQGDDIEVLHTLNAQYVQAYRDADVAWYDAHFAPDYNAVQGDGTRSDRAAALARFAQPSYALHMRAFPVDRVTVRRFGEVALIHAENAYTLKDGREGVSRYTDIWHRQRGGWKCVSAHITEQQHPA